MRRHSRRPGSVETSAVQQAERRRSRPSSAGNAAALLGAGGPMTAGSAQALQRSMGNAAFVAALGRDTAVQRAPGGHGYYTRSKHKPRDVSYYKSDSDDGYDYDDPAPSSSSAYSRGRSTVRASGLSTELSGLGLSDDEPASKPMDGLSRLGRLSTRASERDRESVGYGSHPTDFGDVTVRRPLYGTAPYITTNKRSHPGSNSIRTDYESLFDATSHEDRREVARSLAGEPLDRKSIEEMDPTRRRAAATLDGISRFSEEDRWPGAGKVFRAGFRDSEDYDDFVSGVRMAAPGGAQHLTRVLSGKTKPTDAELRLLENMSSSSDDDRKTRRRRPGR